MEKLTVQQSIILSGFTGILMCDPEDLKSDLEKRLGYQIMMEQFNYENFMINVVRNAYQEDFMALLPQEYLDKKANSEA